jgi:putative oxidoreductase
MPDLDLLEGQKLRGSKMERWLDKYSDQTYSLLRIVAGFLFFCHGAQKILGLFGGADGDGGTVELASQAGVAGIIELIGGLAILLGIGTSWAAFVCSGLMAFAYFIAHQPRGVLPIQNRGELAALYAFLFLYVACKGSGIWSLESFLRKR